MVVFFEVLGIVDDFVELSNLRDQFQEDLKKVALKQHSDEIVAPVCLMDNCSIHCLFWRITFFLIQQVLSQKEVDDGWKVAE